MLPPNHPARRVRPAFGFALLVLLAVGAAADPAVAPDAPPAEAPAAEAPAAPDAARAEGPAAPPADGPSSVEEFVVTAEKVEDLMDVRVESDQLLNVVGVEEFSKFSASDVAEVLERVAGVNVVEGQFAIIRGLEDRYSSTLLDGAAVPSPDPDSQSVQLDLFPSEVVGNLSVAKSFSPELPSNSAGGSINIATHEYPADLEFTFKAGTGWNQNAQDDFLEQSGHTDVDTILNGLQPIGETAGGLPIFPDIEKLKQNGFRFVGGNPIGEPEEKSGNFFDDLSDVLESDYVATLGGRRLFGRREFRFKAVASQETDYGTAQGFDERFLPAAPQIRPASSTPGRLVCPPFPCRFAPPTVIPEVVLKSGDLTLGQLSLTEGRYDLTISEKEKQRTGFAALGFDLDEEGAHRIDGSFLYTQVEQDTVELQSNGYLPGTDYAAAYEGQLLDEPGRGLENVAPSSSIAGSFRNSAFADASLGALAISSFNDSTSFETDRDLWVYQVNGDHVFDRLPGFHASWAMNWTRTTQDESALGMSYFYEPCGFNIPCDDGRTGVEVPSSFPPSTEDLGPGQFAVRNDLLLSANSIEETARFWRIDADYQFDLAEASKLTVAGGWWTERADRDVRSAFLESPSVPGFGDNGGCSSGASTQFVCLDETAQGLGRNVFNDLLFTQGNLGGLRDTTNDASRDVTAWHLRGKLTFYEALDFLGGVRSEKLLITSSNDPFIRNRFSGEQAVVLGGPQTFPSRYLFFDRLDNPFLGEVETANLQRRSGFTYNDELLGNGITPGPCVGDDGSAGSIQCVDFTSQEQLQQFFDGRIDERLLLPSAGFTLRPLEGLAVRGSWSRTVARPSFRELGYYVTVAPGTEDLVVGNPQLQLSNVESYDARVEYTGDDGDLFAVSYFTKTIDDPIESVILRDPLNVELNTSGLTSGIFQTFFNNPNTADLWGVEAEARKSLGFLQSYYASAPDWLEYLSIGGNYTWIDAEVGRTETELARSRKFFAVAPGDTAVFEELAPTRRLFNQPEWIANADVTFDHPEWGLRATVAYFAISDVLDAAGSTTLGANGDVLEFTPDRYVGAFMDLRATIAKTVELPNGLGEMTFRATGKNLTDSTRKLIYDPYQTSQEVTTQSLRLGREWSFSLTFKRRF